MKPTQIVIALVLALFATGGVVAYAWVQMGDVSLSWHGIVALVLGVLVSLGLGIGLMALVFYSSRSGHDDDVGRD